ncbi:MAG: DEAD/DEAH box helicase, partial [bacterium]|nr:DEAD/DEAH box helicase [bacterium]
TAMRRKKVVYLVPLKALAEEKYEDFQQKYTPYGIKVIISTRDHREFDADFEDGNFAIAVVVYEKLAQLLVRRPERLHEIRLIIADELELLSDPERGAQAELLLTRVVKVQEQEALKTPCRLIGLSAVIGHADRLAEWMHARLLTYERRPVELRFGVLHEGTFRYRTYNDYSEAEEELVPCYSESPWEILTENLCELAGRGESCLVFVKARYESRRGAELLADRVDLPPAEDALDALRQLEPTHSRDTLLQTLAHGVAFHNADLSRDERRIVEEAFRKGHARVMVSTSTLAVGLNMPARNVFITADKWQYDSRFGMPWKAPILRSEYENMGGRAGRYGGQLDFGRSILVAATPFDQETLWRRYVEGEREEVEPQLARDPLENHVVRLVTSRACVTEDEVRRFLESTLTGTWTWTRSLTLEEMDARVRAAVNRAVDLGMLTKQPDGLLEATPFGQAAAAKGILPATAQDLAKWIRESETRIWTELDLLLATALTQDGRMLQVTLTSGEYEHADYVGMMKRLTQDEDLSADVPLNRFRNCNLMPFYEEVRAIKVALILSEWLDEAAVFDLEEKYHTLLGQIGAAADQLSWLVDATAAIATAVGAGDAFIKRLTILAERLAFGVREATLPIARLRLPSLSRTAIAAIEVHGLHTPETLADAAPGLLAQWMSSADAQTLLEWAKAHAHRTTAPVESTSTVLVVDDRRPGEILVDGVTVALQEKQYRLIRVLAEAPGECVPYDTIYDAVWGEAVVESGQMHFQKRRLLARVKEAVPSRAALVRTIPKRGFVLDLTPNQVASPAVPAASPAA